MNHNNYSIDNIIKNELHLAEELPIKTIVKTFPKGTVLQKYGNVYEYNFFVICGIVQYSTFTKDNQEKILDFVLPNEFFGVYSFNFPQRAPLLYQISCVTECEFEMIPIKEYRRWLQTSLLLNKLSGYIHEYWFVKRMMKEREMLIETAEERYINLLETRPEIIQQIPVSKIAKYLGIHPDSLSRIRKTTKLAGK
jgi:CRP-like cAMP-binding protein